jgi:outer membrane protein TolC
VSQLDLGNAIYQKLAAKQLQRAADHALQAQRQDSIAAAALGYFDLAFAKAAVGISKEAVGISTNYETQLQHALDAGLAFKGDLLRVSVEVEHNRLALRQAIEQQQVASARLAQTLHLDPAVELVARDISLEPLTLVETNGSLRSFVQQAVSSRPELKQTQALIDAARDDKNGTLYGPIVPTIVGQAFFGGLGGGTGTDWGNFGDQQDYFVGVGWRIGPGGLFDFGRQCAAKARLGSARTALDKVHDEVVRQVVEAVARVRSQDEQIATSRRALAAAEEGLRLAQQRQEFGVGIVLENIVAQQDLTRARNDYLKSVTEFNKAQYGLSKAIGSLESKKNME